MQMSVLVPVRACVLLLPPALLWKIHLCLAVEGLKGSIWVGGGGMEAHYNTDNCWKQPWQTWLLSVNSQTTLTVMAKSVSRLVCI